MSIHEFIISIYLIIEEVYLLGASLYQIEGSMNGTVGRFEWIVDPKLGGVSHRMFIPNGKITGVPTKP